MRAVAKLHLLTQVIYYPGRLINHSLNLHIIILPTSSAHKVVNHTLPRPPHVLRNANYCMPKVPSVNVISFTALESIAF